MIMIMKIANEYPFQHWPLWGRAVFMICVFAIVICRYKLDFFKKNLLIGRDKN